MNVLTERWVVIDGSIFTEQKFVLKNNLTNRNFDEPQRLAIAFNVGKVAEHIVRLHNSSLSAAES